MKTSRIGPLRALVCAPLPPEHDKESGSRRIYHMIRLLRSEGWYVAFVCENAPADSPHVRRLRQLGVPAYVGFDGPTPDLVEAGEFDVAIFAFWYLADRYADLVRRRSPATRIVVDTVDLHWLRKARRRLGGRDGAAGQLDEDFASDFVGEVNAYARADAVLTVSGKEADLVNDLTGDPELAHAVPDYDEVEAGAVPLPDRRGILFVGNFRHPPNLDAVEFLCEEILPLLPPALRREHRVSIVGNAAGERVRRLAATCAGVEVVGWVPSVIPYLHAARASVVPLRYGAGTKRKLVQALMAGTPSVSTPVGVEGLDVADGEHVLVAEDAPSFAEALERILVDEELASRLAAAGRERMLAAHGREVVRERLLDVLGLAVTRPPRGRPLEVAGGAPAVEGGSGEMARVLEEVVPPGESVLVVSKGDPALVDLPDRAARHFPSSGNGGYAGFHPRDSSDAVRHLDDVRGEAGFLVFPSPSLWWLEYYAGFARHLEAHHERVCDRDVCVVYRLRPRDAEGGERVAPTAGSDEIRLGGTPGGTRPPALPRSARASRPSAEGARGYASLDGGPA